MSPEAWRIVPELRAPHVALVPLQHSHAAALGEAAADGRLWELAYTSVPAPDTVDAYVARALKMHEERDALPFTVLDATGAVVGSTRFYQLAPDVPRLAIGYTWYAARVQRTALNTAAKRLLLTYAFDVLACESVGFETSHLNLRSQAAIERLGARRDGILRSHMRDRDGSLRDTHAYSILRSDWPALRGQLDGRLGDAR